MSDTKKTSAFRSKLGNFVRDQYAFVIFIVLILLFSAMDARFRTFSNFMVIGRQATIMAIIAFAATFVITAGEMDLFCGSVASLASMIATMAMAAGVPMVGAILMAIAVGLAFGVFNGVLTAKLRMPSFLLTLGALSIADGLARTLTNNKPVTLYNNTFAMVFSKGSLLGIPVMVWWTLAFFLVCHFVYTRTTFGNRVKATGGNRVAARYTGVNTDRVVISVMAISGAFSGICGLLYTARVNQGRPDFGDGLGLDAVTAVILGGTLFTGGKGSMFTSLMGALILATITDALVILGVPTTIQTLIKGVIILIAVAFSVSGKKKA